VNLASNMLGLGGAATPLGIKAVSSMCDGSGRASKGTVLLLVINATSIQLLPATVIAMLSSHGSVAPSSIIVPSIIATAVSTIVGVILVKVFVKK
jgi:spore maturation protein A